VGVVVDGDDDYGDAKAMSEAAIKILPILFKIVTSSQSPSNENSERGDVVNIALKELSDMGQHAQSIARAISALSRLAPGPFVQGLFKKLMHRLLEEVQRESSDGEKICSLLNLSQALVVSRVLDQASISFLYRALKPLIRNDEYDSRVQKRAYKVLAEMCERYHSFFIQLDRLKELTDLLTGTIVTSQIAARHMRLKCMNIIVDGLDDTHAEHLVSGEQ
jgi:ribosomal RNA-processing protein 12